MRTGRIVSMAGLLAFACAAPALAEQSCESLARLTLPDTVIAKAVRVGAGEFKPPSGGGRRDMSEAVARRLPAFCRVAGLIRPTSDSDIRFEVWLPEAGWNGKFAGVGNGGYSGYIRYGSMAGPLARGYAVAATDTGHQGSATDASFAIGHPEKLVDFMWRAVHEMTVKGKAVTEARYGKPPRLSYWTGCSQGGRQGLKEAQKFPNDYDAILAGAPGNNFIALRANGIWIQQALNDPESPLPKGKLPMIREAALEACDGADGVTDGIVENPLACTFDPAVLQCKAGDEADCLTARQVENVRRIYGGARNPRTGELIYPGPEPTSETDWVGYYPPAFPMYENFWRDLHFNDRGWDIFSLDFDRDVADARARNPELEAIDPDLSAFAARGGKLILWHGWTDPMSPPRNTVDYYRSVLDTLGVDKTSESVRLFMAPGVDHCRGGEGPWVIDELALLEDWREKGVAPKRIVAHRQPNESPRTRPLCPFPQIAHYKGSGSTDAAENFACVMP